MDFKPHYAWEEVEAKLASGELIEGTLWKNERNPDIAYITVKGLRNDV